MISSGNFVAVVFRLSVTLQDNFGCLQVKCLRVLQYFPVPDDPAVRKALESVLKRIITGMLLFANHTLNLFPAVASLRLSLRTYHNISTVGSGHTKSAYRTVSLSAAC